MDYIWGNCKNYSKSRAMFQEDEISSPIYFSCLKKILLKYPKKFFFKLKKTNGTNERYKGHHWYTKAQRNF